MLLLPVHSHSLQSISQLTAAVAMHCLPLTVRNSNNVYLNLNYCKFALHLKTLFSIPWPAFAFLFFEQKQRRLLATGDWRVPLLFVLFLFLPHLHTVHRHTPCASEWNAREKKMSKQQEKTIIKRNQLNAECVRIGVLCARWLREAVWVGNKNFECSTTAWCAMVSSVGGTISHSSLCFAMKTCEQTETGRKMRNKITMGLVLATERYRNIQATANIRMKDERDCGVVAGTQRIFSAGNRKINEIKVPRV